MSTAPSSRKTIRRALALSLGLCCYISSHQAAPLALSTVPLVVGGAVDPNVMLLFDNSGSMHNIVPDVPYDENQTYGSCSGSAVLAADGEERVDIRIYTDGDVEFTYDGTTYSWGTDDEDGCFQSNATYSARLYGDSYNKDQERFQPNSYLPSEYSGNYLNWYFSNASHTGRENFGNNARKRPGTFRRMEIAQTAAADLMDNLNDIRVGLAVYDDDSGDHEYYGARIKEGLADIATNRAALKSTINNLTPGGSTPLAHSFEQLGRYFIQGNNQTLTMHPDSGSPNSKSGYYIFWHQPEYDDSDDIPTAKNPAIQAACQKNFIVALTDGRPQSDHDDVDSDFHDYDGDCTDADPACDDYDKKTTGKYEYESQGSDYLDDVAMALFDIDLRPDFSDYKNNVRSYLVGFADKQVINDPLMDDTAKNGGGEFLKAKNSGELATRFARVANQLAAASAAAASVSFNSSTLLDAGSLLFQATFESSTWTGNLKAIEIDEDGSLPTTTAGVFITDWEAEKELEDDDNTTWSSRNVFTYGDATTSREGIEFTWDNLSEAQKNDLYRGVEGKDVDDDGTVTNIAANIQDADDGKALLNYIKGDDSNEVAFFRQRTGPLGDIVNSSPVYVGTPQLNWPDHNINPLFGSANKNYSDYKSSTTRTPMVYVGANDGMLHGFEANLSDDSNEAGHELMAYIPAAVYSSSNNEGLHYLADPYYTHRFYVDGTPTVSDVFIDPNGGNADKWRTVLVGGLGRGGRGFYALDVSDPDEFDDPDSNADAVVLWEFTNVDDDDLGYTFSQPSIVMMPNGEWAAIFGNGYNSVDERAALFIVFLEGGLDGDWTPEDDYIKIYAEQSEFSANGGLATPRVVDMDGDSVADRVYAGDLNGNLWAFDISSQSPSDWDVAYSGGGGKQPLFSAIHDGTPQPITTAPIVAKHSKVVTLSDNPATPVVEGNEPNALVMFGTGKFLEASDVSGNTDEMSYYSVWDANGGGAKRSNLAERTVSLSGASSTLRTISGDPIDWTTQKGWYMDLPDTGERVISDSLLRRKVLFFNTAIPSTEPCAFGGSGWLMSVDYDTGLAPESAVFDANNDGVIDDADAGAAGQLSDTGMPSGPSLLGDKQYTPDSGGNVGIRPIDPGGSILEGRLNWSEVFRN